MAENKKYYWLKLKDDFFDDDTMQFIEEQENGIKYSNFYLKLCLKSLKNDGRLIRLIGETLIPYDFKSLSKLTNVDIDIVRSSMMLFEQIGLITRLETGELYLNQINEMIGSETRQAEIMRRKRAEQKLIGNNVTENSNNVTTKSNNVTSVLHECYTEIDIDIEKDIEKEKKKDIKHKYGEYKNVLLTDIEHSKLIEQYGELNFNTIIKYLDEYIEMSGKKYKSHYLVILKWAAKGALENSSKESRNFYQTYFEE